MGSKGFLFLPPAQRDPLPSHTTFSGGSFCRYKRGRNLGKSSQRDSQMSFVLFGIKTARSCHLSVLRMNQLMSL